MYQDKIKNEAKRAIASVLKTKANKNIFELSGLKPLVFEPDEWVSDATFVARDILSKRNNEDINKLAVSVTSILGIGESLLHKLANKMLGEENDRKSVSLSEGRALYLLCDYFDLNTIALKNVQWSELFATLTLMQSATITYEQSKVYGDDMLSQGIKSSIPSIVSSLRTEIVDSIARAECLFDKRYKASKSGSSGGEAKAKRIGPLKSEVITRYLNEYQDYSFKKAGFIIEASLKNENSPLLQLSNAEELNLQFSKWISLFKKGKIKLPIQS